MFIDALIEKVKITGNPTVVGLDPKLEYIPEHIKSEAFKKYGENLKGAAAAITTFNKGIINAIYDLVPAVKPQLAYYEMYGIEGIRAFIETVRYSKEKGLLVIADGKRNDIGSTAEAYSKAYLGSTNINDENFENAFNVDALTISPYLGVDGIKPFIDDCKAFGKGIFVLVKTSNKSSGQLQDLLVKTSTDVDSFKPIYEVMAEYVEQWGSQLTGKYGYSSVGAVVGATYPEQAAVLRKVMKNAYILVPGYGAQGGSAEDAARSFNSDGLGAIVNASRSIMCAYKADRWKGQYSENEFGLACRAEAEYMKDDLNRALKKVLG